MSKSAMTPKQIRFVAAYTGNATQAARLAGYRGIDETLNSVGRKTLAKPLVAAAIKIKMAERATKIGLTAEGVLADIRRLTRKAERSGNLSVAMKGKELLGKHFALFTDKIEHTGGLTLEQLVVGAGKK